MKDVHRPRFHLLDLPCPAFDKTARQISLPLHLERIAKSRSVFSSASIKQNVLSGHRRNFRDDASISNNTIGTARRCDMHDRQASQ
jgi:hypothetical protein